MSNDIETHDESAPEAPKKPRKPRKKPVKKAEAPVTTDAPKRRSSKLPNEVRLDGKTVIVSGADPKVNAQLSAHKALHGIKEVTGPEFGQSCKDTACVILFKSPVAAKKFFEYAFGFEDGDGEYEPIHCGTKTDWQGEGLESILD